MDTGLRVIQEQQGQLMVQINRLSTAIDNLSSKIMELLQAQEGQGDSITYPIGPFGSVFARGTSAQSGLTVDLDTGGRTSVEVWVKSSGAAVFNILGSADGQTYRLTQTITLSMGAESHIGFINAYRYVRVTTSTPNNNEIEIVASR